MPHETPRPELSRPVRLGTIPPGGRDEAVRATAGECAALARRFGLPAVESVEATLRLRQETGGTVSAEGHLRADVVQSCVVTLEPVPQRIDEPVSLRFVPEAEMPEEDPDGPDLIPYAGDVLDLGEAVAEQVALALDPYPRAPGAELPDLPEAAAGSPFAALRRLRPQ
ncbi:DUF177 domain-containing protein [Roseomonas sp. NAR14]|uniref:DUF177 domain-containing protein n=1 Tax=Roseomonas acroporae TaxID=2937791 RepID=A0A9X2BWF9_9PROT|nr:DUF177 domain-containing protein [Roseomonas acroporae]MCK8783840.1 DUF177 domain-containing protein [Roseomonas acroporae]